MKEIRGVRRWGRQHRKNSSTHEAFKKFIFKDSRMVVVLSSSVVSDSLRPCGLQHARLLCPSPSPRACSNSCPMSR